MLLTEADAAGTTALNTVDSVGGQTLALFDNPLYWAATNPTTNAHTRSGACLAFVNGAEQISRIDASAFWVKPLFGQAQNSENVSF